MKKTQLLAAVALSVITVVTYAAVPAEYNDLVGAKNHLNFQVPHPPSTSYTLVAKPASMSLSNVLLHTLNTNPKLLAQRSQWQASLQVLKQAKADLLPSVDLLLAGGFERSNSPTLRSAGSTDVDLFRQESDLSVSQTLYSGGARRHGIRQQRQLAGAARYLAIAQNEAVGLAATISYLNVLRQQQLQRLARVNVANHKMVLSKVQRRHDFGANHRGNVELAASRLILAQTIITRTRQASAIAVNDFTAVTGEAPRALRFTITAPYSPAANVNILTQSAFLHNPTILKAKSDLAAAAAAVKVAKASYYPSFMLDVGAGYNRNIDGIRGKNDDLSALLVMNYNLYRGGADQARIRQAAAEEVAADNQLVARYRAVRQQIYDSVRTLQAEKVRIGQLRRYVRMSRRLVASYNKQFAVGKQSLFNVLDAYNQLYNAKVGLLNARYDNAIEYSKLLVGQGLLIKTLTGRSIR